MRRFQSLMMTLTLVGVFAFLGLQVTYAETRGQEVTESIPIETKDRFDIIAQKNGSKTKIWKKESFLNDHYLIIGQTLNIAFPYRVLEGDKIDLLAEKFNTTSFAIKNLNHLEIEELQPGTVLSIPVNSNKMSEERKRFTEKHSQQLNKQKTQITSEEKPKATKKVDTQQKQANKNTASETIVSPSGKNTLQMKATAYNIEGNEKWGNLTASGTTVRHGVVAVDPKVIPLGTKLYVTGYDSPLLPKGGFVAIAEDTGGAIKGNRIDIYIDAPTGTISDFGIQNVKVTILK